MAKSITVQVISMAAFPVTGALIGYTAPPTLNYEDDIGNWLSLPAGSTVTATGFSFLHPTITTIGPHTVSVRDVAAPTVVGTSLPFDVTAPAESPNFTVVSTVGPTIIDATGMSFSLVAGAQIARNGIVDSTTANVTQLAYVNHVVWQQNTALNWYSWLGTGWSTGTTASPLPVESANNTVVTTVGPTITDSAFAVWGITAGGLVSRNGVGDATTASVIELAYVNHVVWQENASLNWYSWLGTAWSAATTVSPLSGTPTPTPSTSFVPSGQFRVSLGKIVSPSGTEFFARGINIFPGSATAAQVLSTFPGINMVRLAAQTGSSASSLSAFVTGLTNANVVVEIEHHAGISGGNNIPTGTAQTTETNWYTSLASTFINNPYVWFGTINEPDNTSNISSVATNQQIIYNAIRATGNKNPIMLEMRGGWTNDFAVQNASIYASMTNVIWDVHYYNWISGRSTNSATVASFLNREIIAGPSVSLPGGGTMVGAQNVRSADGLVPCIIGEYGPSTTGALPDDPGGQLAVLAVQASVGGASKGSLAWIWHAGDADMLVSSGTTLTTYGQEVAAWIAGQSTAPFGTTFSP